MLGDSTRLTYQDRLSRLVSEEGLEVVGPGGSTGDAAGLAAGAEAWVEEFKPDITCFACGPWPTEALLRVVASRDGLDAFEPGSLGDFDRGLMDAVAALQRWCGRQLVYVTTPPVHEERLGRVCGDPDFGRRLNSWIAQYNQQAVSLLGQLNVGAADLYHEISRYDDDALADDGVTLSPAGVELAARVAAKGIYGVVHP